MVLLIITITNILGRGTAGRPSTLCRPQRQASGHFAAIIFNDYRYFHGQTHLNFPHLSLSRLPFIASRDMSHLV